VLLNGIRLKIRVLKSQERARKSKENSRGSQQKGGGREGGGKKRKRESDLPFSSLGFPILGQEDITKKSGSNTLYLRFKKEHREEERGRIPMIY